MVYVRCAVPPPGEAAHVIRAEERAGSDGGGGANRQQRAGARIGSIMQIATWGGGRSLAGGESFTCTVSCHWPAPEGGRLLRGRQGGERGRWRREEDGAGGWGRGWRLSLHPCAFVDMSLSKHRVFSPLISSGPCKALLRSGPELVAAAQAEVLAWLPEAPRQQAAVASCSLR